MAEEATRRVAVALVCTLWAVRLVCVIGAFGLIVAGAVSLVGGTLL